MIARNKKINLGSRPEMKGLPPAVSPPLQTTMTFLINTISSLKTISDSRFSGDKPVQFLI